ncbi:MAG: hypothetical protein HFI90_12605 [Clostridia bacterium]|nr:hypothetical protein [Clostridia bacterium]
MFCMKCGTFLNVDGVCPKCGARYKLPEEGGLGKAAPNGARQQTTTSGAAPRNTGAKTNAPQANSVAAAAPETARRGTAQQQGHIANAAQGAARPQATAPQTNRAAAAPRNTARSQGGGLSAGGAKRNLIAWAIAAPALIFLFFFVIYPCLLTLIMAFIDYSPAAGLFGSRFVGTDNLMRVFDMYHFTEMNKNTLFYGFFILVLGSIYVFGATYGVASMKNVWLKCGVLSALLLPVFLPAALVAKFLLPAAWLKNASTYRIGPLLNAVFCFAPIAVLAGAFIGKRMPPLKCALFTACCYACLHLIQLFSPENSYIFLSYSPLTYETADIFDTYIYRTAMLNFQYSAGAAMFYYKMSWQITPAIVGTIGMIFLANVEKKRPLKERQTAAGPVAAWVLGLVGVVLTICIISAFAVTCPFENGGVSLGNIGVFRSLMLSIGGWLIVALVAVSLSYGMANGGNMSKAVMLCVGSIVLLGWSNDIGRYMLLRSSYMADSKFRMILQYGTYGIFGAYLLFIAAGRQRSGTWKEWLRKILAPGAALSGVAFAKIFGDAVFAQTMSNKLDNTFGIILRKLISNVPEGISFGQDVAVPSVVWVGCLIPVVVGLACIWLGGYLQNRAANRK